MKILRRTALASVAVGLLGGSVAECETAAGERGTMYGLIGKMKAVAGKRDDLVAILLAGVSAMPGCLSYVVANDPGDADALWVTEVWDSEASHKASLELPSVKGAMAKGRPLIASFGDYHITQPVGGFGISSKP